MMTHGLRTPALLVAGPTIRRNRIWTELPELSVHVYGRDAFSIATHLSPDIPLLLYQMDTRTEETLRFLDTVSKRQSDLCVILLGKDIGSDRVAQLLRHGAFDYMTWPCTAARVMESISSGLANRHMFLEVRNLSEELARTNQALAQDRDVLTQCNRKLSVLNQLTQNLVGSLETEAIVRTLFTGLPQLLHADVMGLVRTNPEHVWTWSRSHSMQREEQVRAQLLSRLSQKAGRITSRQTQLRLVGVRPLTLVPAPTHAMPDSRSAAHDVRLTIGPQSMGILHIERDSAIPFTEQEQQLLATVGASLALTLRNADTHQEIQDLALRDPLTEVLNRRALDGPLIREIKAGVRYGTPACLILLDLDFFKTVNDVLGHMAGDEVLKEVAALVRETVREVDSVGRYGGEEFAVVLPHTDLNQAQTLAERIRAIIERHAFDLEDSHVRMTVSIGIASLHVSSVTTVAEWIAAADAALYEAKAQGRNRVVTHTPDFCVPAQAAALCGAA